MTGVARQEDPPLAVAVSQQLAGDPFVAAQHLIGQVYARRPRDQCPLIGHTRLPRRIDVRGHEEPGVAPVHGADQAGSVAIHLPVHDGRPVPVSAVQARRAEHDIAVARQAVLTQHAGADQVTHPAARAVGANQVVGTDRRFRAARQIAQPGPHAVRVLAQVQQFAAVADLDARQRLRVIAQHALDRVLRNPLRMLRIQRIASGRAVHGVLVPGQLDAGQARAEHHIGRVVHARRGGPQAVRDAPAPQVLARAHIGGLGARRVSHRSLRSITRQAMPRCPNSIARLRPAGPAPTIRTRGDACCSTLPSPWSPAMLRDCGVS